MASTSRSLRTPIFTGKNYGYWSLTMKVLFRGQDVWKIVQHGYVELADMTAYNNLTHVEKDVLREQRKKDGKALFYIHQAMHESILRRVASITNAKKVWDTLETTYQGLDKEKTSKLYILRRDFESLSMKDSETIDTFYTRVVGLINQLKSHGEAIEERRVVEKILKSLPPIFENFVMTLEEHIDMSTFTIDELQASLINHEHRLNRTQTSLEGAFATQSSISRSRCRGEKQLQR